MVFYVKFNNLGPIVITYNIIFGRAGPEQFDPSQPDRLNNRLKLARPEPNVRDFKHLLTIRIVSQPLILALVYDISKPKWQIKDTTNCVAAIVSSVTGFYAEQKAKLLTMNNLGYGIHKFCVFFIFFCHSFYRWIKYTMFCKRSKKASKTSILEDIFHGSPSWCALKNCEIKSRKDWRKNPRGLSY